MTSPDREKVIYELVKSNKISLDDFRDLIYESSKENQRQIDLDSIN